MLEEMGVRVVEVEGMSHAACYVSNVAILLVRPNVDEATIAAAAERALGVTA